MKSLQKRASLEQESLPCLGVLLSFNMWWAAGAERKVRLCQGGGRARAEEHERRRQAQQQRRRWHSQHSQNARSARSSSCRGDKAGRIHRSGGRSPRRQSACKPVRLGTPRNAGPATTRTRPDAQAVRNGQVAHPGAVRWLGVEKRNGFWRNGSGSGQLQRRLCGRAEAAGIAVACPLTRPSPVAARNELRMGCWAHSPVGSTRPPPRQSLRRPRAERAAAAGSRSGNRSCCRTSSARPRSGHSPRHSTARRRTPLTSTPGCPRAQRCREAGCSTTSKGISLSGWSNHSQ